MPNKDSKIAVPAAKELKAGIWQSLTCLSLLWTLDKETASHLVQGNWPHILKLVLFVCDEAIPVGTSTLASIGRLALGSAPLQSYTYSSNVLIAEEQLLAHAHETTFVWGRVCFDCCYLRRFFFSQLACA